MKSDFEKLIIARHFVEALKKQVQALEIQIGIITSERDEAIYNAEQALIKASEIVKTAADPKTYPAAVRQAKKDQLVIQYKEQLKRASERNKRITADNRDLVNKLAVLRKKHEGF